MDQTPLKKGRPAGRRMRCRICAAPAVPFVVRAIRFYRCPVCGLYMRAPSCRPGTRTARARYLLHNNNPQDPRYRAWLERFIEAAIIPFAQPGASILDYGCGPEPLLTDLLAERAFMTAGYDLYFSPGRAWKNRTWDIIVLHEVLEHLPEPLDSLRFLKSLLAPGGHIAIRTQPAPESLADFARWWYKEDTTHLCMFSPASIERLSASIGLGTPIRPAPDMFMLSACNHPYSLL